MCVNEFTVAQITPDSGLPYHEWFIEFEQEPENWSTLQKDNEMRKQNIYYDDLIVGNILKKVVVITAVAKMVFRTT
jgi:hypothetical protein